MSTPLTASQTLAALNKWHVPHRAIEGWEHRNRAPRPFGPMNGFVVHHTGDDAPDYKDRAVIVNGRADLPGPLAQFGLDDHGVVELVGCGRANHAGGGDPRVLAEVVHESYGDYPSPSRYHDGSPGEVDGNTHFYGVETYYSGGHAMTAAQMGSLVLLLAAICDAHKWSAKSVIGHKEWSDWKSDPGHVDMKLLRRAVAARLKAGPPKPAAPKPVPAPAPSSPGFHNAAVDLRGELSANPVGSPKHTAAAKALDIIAPFSK